ncbi:MAG: lipopolysaccharide heptosyltransferase II [Ignavibacteria bacterium]|nr:lipopolysaccharide heptosyltransferase II [Ignavibacteria bacterium]
MNILVLRLSSLGDVILTSPVYRLLRKKFPSARIDVLVKKEFADVLRYNPNINTIIEFGSPRELSLRIIRNALKLRNYDVVIDLHNSLRTRLLRFGVAQQTFVIDKDVWKRFLLVKFKANLFEKKISIPEKYIRTLLPLGIKNDDEGSEIYFPNEVKQTLNSVILSEAKNLSIDENKILRFTQEDKPKKNLIALCPTARHKTKMWLKENFIQLANVLIEQHNAFIVILAAPNEIDYCESIKSEISNQKSVINLAGKISLLETAALMDLCNVVVTNDSANLHIASARKKNVVAIFGSSVEEFGFFPYRTNAKALQVKNLECRPCSHIGLEHCPKAHFRCMKEISVEMVVNVVKEMLE